MKARTDNLMGLRIGVRDVAITCGSELACGVNKVPFGTMSSFFFCAIRMVLASKRGVVPVLGAPIAIRVLEGI